MVRLDRIRVEDTCGCCDGVFFSKIPKDLIEFGENCCVIFPWAVFRWLEYPARAV